MLWKFVALLPGIAAANQGGVLVSCLRQSVAIADYPRVQRSCRLRRILLQKRQRPEPCDSGPNTSAIDPITNAIVQS